MSASSRASAAVSVERGMAMWVNDSRGVPPPSGSASSSSRPLGSRRAAKMGWRSAIKGTPARSRRKRIVSTMKARSGITVSMMLTGASHPSLA